jgi:hypothetical protein
MKSKVRVASFNFSIPFDSENIAIYLNEDSSPEILHRSLFEFILSCTEFCTLEEHAHVGWKKLSFRQKRRLLKPIAQKYLSENSHFVLGPKMFIEMLKGILENLLKKGFFIAEDWVSSMRVEPKFSEKITSLGIITCDRPQNLLKSLTSYADNLLSFGRTVDIVICDDSKEEKMRDANKQVIKSVQKTRKINVWYAGLEEKKAYAKQLVSSGIPEDVVDFSLFDLVSSNYSYGANCNAFFIHTAGELTFVTDDDTVCEIAYLPNFESGISLENMSMFHQVWFCKDRETAVKTVHRQDLDLLQSHEAFLGKSISECLLDLKPELIDQTSMTPRILEHLKKKSGRIVLTHNGLYGDSGSNSPLHSLFTQGDTRERMLRSEEVYNDIFHSREIIKGHQRVVILPAKTCMSTFYGADNRSLVPPFFPYFRNCDALFGRMYEICDANSYFVHLPSLLLHSPPEPRFHSRQAIANLSMMGFLPEEVIQEILDSGFGKNFYQENLALGIKRAGEILMDFASLPSREIHKYVVQKAYERQSQKIAAYESLLEKFPKSPDYWVRDVKLVRDHLKEALMKFQYSDQKLANQTTRVQGFVRDFGRLAYWWPDLMEAAKSLKVKGIRLAARN